MTRRDLAGLVAGSASLQEKISSGAIQVAGDPAGLAQVLALTEKFEFWWNVSTPNPPER
jgi:alkyl sulfatase BDS1-like metallo-beta-lactamase superfamily hydrolase